MNLAIDRARLREFALQAARFVGRCLRSLAVVTAKCAALLLIVAAGAAAAIYWGWYEVAATAKRTAPGELLLDFTLRRSVAVRARAVGPPPETTIDALRRGAAHYRRSCEACHRGPGVSRASIADGLNPSPADLALAASRWTPGELFWIVQNGIRMTGMPAWRDFYTEREIWDIAALVHALPRMSPAEYEELRALCDPACD